LIDGEIYICPGEARRNARIFNESFESEILRYVAHGILHLLGQKDQASGDRAKMRVQENDLLALLTYPR
jgi:rRNA maturation RNase YbeY